MVDNSEAEAPEGAAGAAPEGARAGDPTAGNARERREAARYGELARRNDEMARELAQLRSRLAEAEEAGNKARVSSIEREIEAASTTARQAFADGDPEAHVKAVRDVADLSARKALAEARPVSAPVAAAPAAPVYTTQTQAWLDENPWFHSNQDARKEALKAHGAAKASGLVEDTPAYWSFVQERVNRTFPGLAKEPEGFSSPAARAAAGDKGEGGAGGAAGADPATAAGAGAARPAAAHSGAAPVSRGSPTTKPGGAISLTAEQLEAAKVSGVTPQQYMAALAAGQQSGAFVPAARRA